MDNIQRNSIFMQQDMLITILFHSFIITLFLNLFWLIFVLKSYIYAFSKYTAVTKCEVLVTRFMEFQFLYYEINTHFHRKNEGILSLAAIFMVISPSLVSNCLVLISL